MEWLSLYQARYCCSRPTYPEEELDEENIVEDDTELDLNNMHDTKDEVSKIVAIYLLMA